MLLHLKYTLQYLISSPHPRSVRLAGKAVKPYNFNPKASGKQTKLVKTEKPRGRHSRISHWPLHPTGLR